MLNRVFAAVPLLLLVGIATADPSNWLGVPTPEERQALRQKVLATYHDLGLGPLPLIGPGADDYPDIRGKQIHARLEEIVGFSEECRRDGNILWGRIAGTKYGHETAAYVQRKFNEAGLQNIHADSMPRNAQWWPTKSRLSIVMAGPGGNRSEYVFRSAFPAPPSPSTSPGGLEAEMVDVGLGRPVDLIGRDLHGKVAVLRSLPELGTVALLYTGRGLPLKLAQMGAIGVITIVEAPGNAQTYLYSSYAGDVPAYVLGADDGDFLEALLGRAQPSAGLRIRMELETEQKQGWTMENVMGTIPGATDEWVMVMAHQDGWFDGAVDNASGLATMLTLADHYARESKKRQLRRSMLFFATGGHHLSLVGLSDKLGPASPGIGYLADHYRQILAKTVLVLNSEHTASVATQTGGDLHTETFVEQPVNTENPRVLAITDQSPRMLEFAREAIDRYGLVVSKITRHIPYGDAGMLADKLPVMNLIETMGWYHSTADTPEQIPAEGLERTARAFAYLLDKVEATSRAELTHGALPRRDMPNR
jgi:hypothetical protein